MSGPFPPPLAGYQGEEGLSLLGVLAHRVRAEPLNAVATAIFALAILHTFLAPRLLATSNRLRRRAREREGASGHSVLAEALHFLGEIEVVFGVWVVPLLAVIVVARGRGTAEAFMRGVDFTEAVFVVVVMALCATRPVLAVAERLLGALARLGGGTPMAWWVATLAVGPLLGSLITEPAAMIICALLLGRRVLVLGPSVRLRYATVGLLFVNVSVGGTLTHFAAPPVLMVAGRWGWDTRTVLTHLGWKAAVAIALSTALYALLFRGELSALAARAAEREERERRPPVPAWIVAVHLGLLALVVLTSHTPAIFVGAFLLFLGFHVATAPHQHPLDLRAPILVGFFLAGLVVHGALQQWWLAPVLGRLDDLALLLGAAALTAFNDNAAITYLASLVPGFGPGARYAVVAGAVAGGGLTVIANAPNPAGQAALARHFPDGVAPLPLLLGAAAPTAIVLTCFLLLP
ncbi:MAG TPA: putative Na+/H+ antiporter [Anaeromyxobacter sp.]|nr:putative Na+/H+ antiporter [Anaeromyxobacter sp.]